MVSKNWNYSQNNKDKAAEIAEEYGLEPLAALLLVSRGFTESEQIDGFLFGDEPERDPFLIADMDKAVDRIGRAVDNFEKIMIFGDYDADGVTSTSLLYLYLSSQGADVDYYIPDRTKEGYGISESAVRKFAQDGIKLIVTVDNGISAVYETELAKGLGIDVVVTDHHKVGDVLPDAIAVVNPHRADSECDFRDYAGVGVVFKLVCALEGDADAVLDEYSDLVAIGTLADVVPVIDENRTIIKHGIEKINKSPRIGVDALKIIAGVSEKQLNASSVLYSIAPRINAAGRMGSAMLAMKLLLSDSPSQADELAAQTDAANKERQKIENEITMRAVEYIESNDSVKYAPVIVVAGEGWHQGVIGIVAARLVSKYGKPAVVISTDGETGKGSCRSLEGYSIYDALLSVKDMLNHFGGHTLAAGFSINTADIDLFRTRLCSYKKAEEMPFMSINIDFNIKPSLITNSLLVVLGLFEPYGSGNPQPCFAVKNLVLKAIKPVGEGRHLRLTFSKDGFDLTAMLFSTTQSQFGFALGSKVDIAFRVERNEFRGEVKPSVHITDIRYSDMDFEAYASSIRLYEKYKSGAGLNQKETEFLIPDRNFFSSVYRFLLSEKTFSAGTEAFCERSGCKYSDAARVLVSLDVMCELGLVSLTGSGYRINAGASKVDLNTSEILKEIAKRGRNDG